ncbi:MAG: hypothetical protein EOO74_08720, partial [Myxococcales bacterium]
RFSGELAATLVAIEGLEVSPGTGKKKKKKTSPIEGELAEVERLLERMVSLDPEDSKLAAFVQRVQGLGPDVKLLIFTEFRATQSVLVAALRQRFGADSVATINGSMNMLERRRQVDLFNEQTPNPRFMVSTEAGGEGLNMQKSCHTIVNYDLPWNPMALQQRIGRVYRYGQSHPVVVFNLKVESTSEAFADQRVYSYLETKIEEITRQLQEVQDGDPEDLRNEVLGQVASQIQLDEIYKQAVEEGQRSAEKQIDRKAGHIAQILADPTGMLGLFKGLERFDITHYEKVAARVSSAHLEFFIRQYLGHQGATVKKSPDGLLSFTVPRALVDVSMQLLKSDPYQTRDALKEVPVERATADKEVAQRTLGCRLLRFGDAAFEAMVKHAQHGGFSSGVASLELPADTLGWAPGDEGTWLLFDLKIVRQENNAGGSRILRNELASFLVPSGGTPVDSPHTVEALHEALD